MSMNPRSIISNSFIGSRTSLVTSLMWIFPAKHDNSNNDDDDDDCVDYNYYEAKKG